MIRLSSNEKDQFSTLLSNGWLSLGAVLERSGHERYVGSFFLVLNPAVIHIQVLFQGHVKTFDDSWVAPHQTADGSIE